MPSHRMTPLKNSWEKVYAPLVEHMKLQVRMNLKLKSVELRVRRCLRGHSLTSLQTCPLTQDPGALQKGAEFVKAFILGFDVADSIALLRLDDLFIESFEIKDGSGWPRSCADDGQ